MAVNRVDCYGDVLIDISDTTAVESTVAAGEIFYRADGTRAVGTADYQPKITTQTISLGTEWSGSDPYNQIILTGQDPNLQVNLNPSPASLQRLAGDGVTSMVAANINGTVRVYAYGAVPSLRTIQITKIMTEQEA